MKFLILVSCAMAVQVGVYTEDVCIDGVRQQTELLLKNVTINLDSMAVDYSLNNLYFIDFERTAVLSLNSGEHKYIEGVSATRSLTVDQETHDLYIGTSRGIYKYNPSTDVVDPAGAADVYIRHVFFKRILYYIDYMSERVFTIRDGHSEQLDSLQYSVRELVIDNEDVMFLRNNSGLFTKTKESNQTYLYYNETFAYSLAVDTKGDAYLTTYNDIFKLKYNATMRSVVATTQFSGIAFDKDNNIIYSSSHEIYRLKLIPEGDIANNCSGHQIDVVNNGTTAVDNQLERKLDVMYKRIEKLVTEQLLKKLESMNMEIHELSQKIDKLTDQVERKVEAERIDTKTVKPLSGPAEEQLQHDRNAPRMIHIDISS